MKKVLINIKEEGRICEVVEAGQEFEVHSDFTWIDCPHDEVTDAWIYEETNGTYTFTEVTLEDLESTPKAKEDSFNIAREIGYGDIGAQLDMIYREIMEKGSISADGEWAKHITAVKTNIPKK